MSAITTGNPGLFQVFGKQLNPITEQEYKTSTKIITVIAIALIALSVAALIATGVGVVYLTAATGFILTPTVIAVIGAVSLGSAARVISTSIIAVKLAKIFENLKESDVSEQDVDERNRVISNKLTQVLGESIGKPEKMLNKLLTAVPLNDYPQLEIADCSEIRTLKRENLDTEFEFQNRSTMEAIVFEEGPLEDREIIAINFANEYHAGGGPGMGPLGNKIVRYASRCRAQEEEMVTTTDFLLRIANLTNKFPVLSMMRLYTGDARGFSKNGKCLTGRVIAFGSNKNAKDPIISSQQPLPFTVVASAAQCLSRDIFAMSRFARIRNQEIEVLKQDPFFDEMKRRIKQHLIAAANTSVKDGQKRVLIAGAFGCGAFAPKHKAKIDKQYVKVVSALYKDFLESDFSGYFDKVIMAFPNFGTPEKPDVCYEVFSEKFASAEVS